MKMQRWTGAEDGELVFLIMLGQPDDEIGRALKRSAASVDHRARRLGLRMKGHKSRSPSGRKAEQTVSYDDEIIPNAAMWAKISAACDLHLVDLGKHHHQFWPSLNIPHERDAAFHPAVMRSGLGSSAAMCADLGE